MAGADNDAKQRRMTAKLFVVGVAVMMLGCGAAERHGYEAHHSATQGRPEAPGSASAERMNTVAAPADLAMNESAGAHREIKTDGEIASEWSDAADAGESSDGGDGSGGGAEFRRYFPETMFVDPQLITDERGDATIRIDRMPDSITTWLVRALAHTPDGVFGEGRGQFRVFQDIFLNLQIPPWLTAGDTVTVPLTVMNFSEMRIDAMVTIQRAGWFEIIDGDRVRGGVDPGTANRQYATIRVIEPGDHELVVRAVAGSARDTVALPVSVEPAGIRRRKVQTLRIASSSTLQLAFPSVAPTSLSDDAAAAIDADAVRRVYITATPSSLAQLVMARQALLRYPTGCLEQTLSQTLIDVELSRAFATLETADGNAAVARARDVLAFAYQRILGYFDGRAGRFGSYPGRYVSQYDAWLTTYAYWVLKGIGEFVPVDPEFLARLEREFANDVQAFGDHTFTQFGLWAYFAGRKTSSGNPAKALPTPIALLLERLRSARLAHRSALDLALMLNIFATLKDPRYNAVMDELLGRFEFGSGDAFHLPRLRGADGVGVTALTPARGQSAAQEVAALMLLAMAEYGSTEPIRDQLATLLLSQRTADGIWDTTFSTALTLRALASVERQRRDEGTSARSLAGTFNGTPFDPLSIGVGAGAPMQQIHFDAERQNSLELTPMGEVQVQIVQETYFPDASRFPLESQAFDLRVVPQADTLRQGDTTRLAISLVAKSISAIGDERLREWWPGDGYVPAAGAHAISPVVVSIPIPGTFRVLEDGLEILRQTGRIDRYEVSGRHVVLYLSHIPANGFEAEVTIFAQYAGIASAAPASAFDYYNPSGYGYAAPLTFRVTR